MTPTRYDNVPEGATFRISQDLTDEGGVLVPKVQLVSTVATLFATKGQGIINGRNGQSVLDANNGTVSTAGELTLNLTPLDNVIIDDTKEVESHELLLTWVYDSGNKTQKKRFWLMVDNLFAGATPAPIPTAFIYEAEGLAVPQGQDVVITHNLNNSNAQLKSFIPYWGPTAYRILSKGATTITVRCAIPVPSGGSFVDVEVKG